VRTKQRASVFVEQRAARDRTEAYHDARALVFELARRVPAARFDAMKAGVVLELGETVYRQVPLWIRVQEDGCWAGASFADVIVTDLRLLCRMASGRLTSLWWKGVVGLHIDLSSETMVLDFGDGQPVGLFGAQVVPISVAAIASVYGTEGLVAHPALASIRRLPTASP